MLVKWLPYRGQCRSRSIYLHISFLIWIEAIRSSYAALPELSISAQKEGQANCTFSAIDNFPGPLMPRVVRQSGGIVVHTLVSLYLLLALANVCEEYFVPSLEVLCDKLELSEEIAGSVVMAISISTSDIVIIAGFLLTDQVNIGTTALLGYGFSNSILAIAICALFADRTLELGWWAVVMDSVSYVIVIFVFGIITLDSYITWYESAIFLSLYGCYLMSMALKEPQLCLKRNEDEPMGIVIKQEPKPSRGGSLLSPDNAIREEDLSYDNGDSLPDYSSEKEEKRFDIKNKYLDDVKEEEKVIDKLNCTESGEENSKENCNKSDNGSAVSETFDGDAGSRRNSQLLPIWPMARSYSVPANRLSFDFGRSFFENNSAPRFSTISELSSDPSYKHYGSFESESGAVYPGCYRFSSASMVSLMYEDDELKPWDIPARPWQKCVWALALPIQLFHYILMPDVRISERRQWYIISFIISILCIALYSYFLIWMLIVIGHTFGMPDDVVGFLFIGVAISIPNVFSVLCVARQGLGKMAFCSSFGSNIMVATVALGMPWLIQTLLLTKIVVRTNDSIYLVFTLCVSVLAVVLVLAKNQFKLEPKIGVLLLTIYMSVMSFAVSLMIFGFLDFSVSSGLPTCT